MPRKALKLRTLILLQLCLFAALVVALPYFTNMPAFMIGMFLYVIAGLAIGALWREAWRNFEEERVAKRAAEVENG